MEADGSFLTIYDGGSEQAQKIEFLDTAINNTKISTPGNQIFVVFNTNGNIRFYAAIIESK